MVFVTSIKTYILGTIMIQIFWTNRPGQRVQAQIRLLIEEQSYQGLTVCYSIYIFLTKYPKDWPFCLNFRLITAVFWRPKILELYGSL